jgi:regulator of sigma E protease
VFEHPTDRENEGTPPTTTATVGLEPAYQTNAVELPSVGTGVAMYPAEHLLGLAPLAKVADAAPAPPAQGLERGDVFLKVGDAAYPTVADAIREIRARARGRIDLLVQRAGPDGEPITVAIEAEVSAGGTVGFLPDNAWRLPVLGRTPEFLAAADEGEQASQRTSADLPAQRLGLRPVLPGTRIAAVVPPDPDATPIPVSSFAGLRDALRAATADALDAGESVTVTLRAEVLPPPAQIASLDAAEPAAATETPLPLTPRDIRRLHDLGYEAPGLAEAFRPVEVTIKADGPADALVMGAAATKRILTQTYLTLRRLVEGSVPVNKLQGPVGITYTGSRFAEQGLTKLLFFLALISANLAVINFLPIPITDGGQFLLLAWEGLRGKPAPVVVQNALTLIGLVLIASLFLYVTYHDILRIF